MMSDGEFEGGRVVLIKGRVHAELRDGTSEPIAGVLIKTSQGEFTHTNDDGEFSCSVLAVDEYYAVCAFKNGFQPWVDWRPLTEGAPDNAWEIYLSPGPDGASCDFLSMRSQVRALGYIVPLVINKTTKKAIPYAEVKLDSPSQTWQLTNSKGTGRVLSGTVGTRLLKARRSSNYPVESKSVDIALGVTIGPDPNDLTDCSDPAIICID